MTEDRTSWDRIQGEPSAWFDRFDRFYRPLGAERSIEKAFKAFLTSKGKPLGKRRPGQLWYDKAREWKWAERAEAWDAAERAERLKKEVQLKDEWQENRRKLLITSYRKIAEAVLNLKPGEAKFYETMTAVKMILEQNRLEFGLPTEITQLDQTIDLEFRDFVDED